VSEEQTDFADLPVLPAELLTELAKSFPEDGYSNTDRYRDFRRTFLGSPEGRRTLYAILGWSHVNGLSFNPFKADEPANAVAFREGERHIGLQMLAVMVEEPKATPAKVVRRKPKP